MLYESIWPFLMALQFFCNSWVKEPVALPLYNFKNTWEETSIPLYTAKHRCGVGLTTGIYMRT